MLQRYFVTVDHPDYKTDVHTELQAYQGSSTIPVRSVQCIDSCDGSEYNGIFMLSADEAAQLVNDPRVRAVEQPAADRGLYPSHSGIRSGPFDRSSTVTYGLKNWALSRCINNYDNFSSFSSTSTPYTYNLDGTGVDIIIMDTGVEAGHPELAVNADGTGGSRVVSWDWTQYSFISPAPTGGFLGDWDGHGSNVATIAAGNTCGWAPGAAVYSLRVVGSDSGNVLDITTKSTLGLVDEFSAWESIRAFHLAKIPTSTGYIRPTIVSCSYAYNYSFSTIKSVNYRGTTYTTSTFNANYGLIKSLTSTFGARISYIEAEIESCIAAGIVVVGAAGNNSMKVDVPTGIDYNNYYVDNSNTTYYYHQGNTPGATPGCICVGATDIYAPDHKVYFSATGPRVDIFAPGVEIMGAYSNTNYIVAAVQDGRNTSYYLNKISGTSQATPNVTGLSALLLSLRPWYTATNVLNWINSVSSKGQLSESYYTGYTLGGVNIGVGTYTNLASLQGATNGYLYMPFNSATPGNIS